MRIMRIGWRKSPRRPWTPERAPAFAGSAVLEGARTGDGDSRTSYQSWKVRNRARRLVCNWTPSTAELETLQGDAPLVRVCVDSQTIGEVISAWTGIPVGKMLKDDAAVVLGLERHLGSRIVGQPYALEQIAQSIRTSRAGWKIRTNLSVCFC